MKQITQRCGRRSIGLRAGLPIGLSARLPIGLSDRLSIGLPARLSIGYSIELVVKADQDQQSQSKRSGWWDNPRQIWQEIGSGAELDDPEFRKDKARTRVNRM
jgi:hypothetical protein